MNTTIKRMLTALLALLMLTGVVFGTVACAEQEENKTETTAAAGEDSVVEGETKLVAYETMNKQDFGGREFSIVTREDLLEDMQIEAQTGDILDDLIFERNTRVSEDFGVSFAYYPEDHYEKVNQKISLQANSNLDEFDMYIGHKYSFAANAQQNHCYNLNKIESLRLDQPWWDQNCYNNLTVDGKTFMMTGDILPSSMRISACMVVNKDLMKDLQKDMDALNQLTSDGGWTLDTLCEYTTDVTTDLNGDGVFNYADDRFGLTAWAMDIPFSLYYGAGSNFVTLVDGQPTFSENASANVTDIYDKIYKIVVTNNAYYISRANQDKYNTNYEVFRDGRALFCDITLGKITTFIADIGMDNAYGILPIPKYDENQKEYLSFVNGASGFTMVCSSEKDTEFVGTIMEAMASFNYDNVTPKMFQVVTKLQAAQDPVSAAMVDYIVRNRIYDLAYFFDFKIANMVLDNLESKNATIAAALRANTKAAGSELRKLVKAYEKCDIG